MTGLLDGVKVLDATSVVMGPYCTRYLAAYGADVVKLEAPVGDVSRGIGARRNPGMSSMFIALNTGKRSIALDLKSEAGQRVLGRLVAWADVVVHNMQPEVAASLGLTYERVRALNPSAVYCATVGFGRDGRYRDERAYDDVIQGAAGLAHVQGVMAGTPHYLAAAVADKTVGLLATSAIAAALYRREAGDGRGCEIEVPMLETMVENILVEHAGGLLFDPPEGPPLYARTSSPERRPFKTRDSYVCAVVYTDADWRALLAAVGREAEADDPRLETVAARVENTAHAYGLLNEIFTTRSTAEWLELLGALDIAAMPMNSIEDLYQDPHLTEVAMFDAVEHPSEGRIRPARPPLTVDGDVLPSGRPAPRLGADTREVLEELGFDEEEIEGLVADVTVVRR